MNACRCPSAERLKEYVSGRLDEGTHAQIDVHLDGCPVCQDTVAGLDDPVHTPFPLLRKSPPADPASPDPAFQQLVSHVKAIGKGLNPPNCHVDALLHGMAGETILGNYVLLELIGAGGMGTVYKARHRRMKRFVALKVLAPELLRSATARDRFQREVEAAARLTSPHIVAAYDASEADGRDYLVMEYVEGRNLADLVKQEGPLPVRQALEYILQAARGLEHAHAAGIIHRDIKPSNLLLSSEGVRRDGPGSTTHHSPLTTHQIKVLDMGLARVQWGDEPRNGDLTGSGIVMGTAAFMAPEQALDTRRADHRADIYSLGCSLYYLLTGRPPYEGQTPLEIVLAHREQPIPSLCAARSDCPPEVDVLFRAMIAKAPEDRCPNMHCVIRALERLLADRPVLQPSAISGRGKRWLVAGAVALAAGVLVAQALLPPLLQESPVPVNDPPAEPVQNDHRPPVPAVEPRPVQNDHRPSPAVEPHLAAPAPAEAEPPPRALAKPRPSKPELAGNARPRPLVIEMMKIAVGEFWMGSPDSDVNAMPSEKPRHRVKLTRPFYLGKYEVTQEQFQEVTGTNPSAFAFGGRSRTQFKGADPGQLPVESVSWLDAVRFCNRLSERNGLKPFYHIDGTLVTARRGDGYRLPTEAEWEYACRAGTESRWSFGDHVADVDLYVWHAGNSGSTTRPVGQKKPNPWGLYDMHGNVPEWCWDRYDAAYYKHPREIDPAGPGEGAARVYRGGGWDIAAVQTRSATRESLGSTYSALTLVGFRLARDAEP